MHILLIFLALPPVKAPSPSKAMLYSAIFPGGGQFYTGSYIKGAVMAGLSFFLLSSAYVNYREAEKYDRASPGWNFYRKEAFSYGLYYLGLYLYSIADAYISAHLYRVDSYFENKQKRKSR